MKLKIAAREVSGDIIFTSAMSQTGQIDRIIPSQATNIAAHIVLEFSSFLRLFCVARTTTSG